MQMYSLLFTLLLAIIATHSHSRSSADFLHEITEKYIYNIEPVYMFRFSIFC
jgi:predicted DNA-binding protein